MAERAQTAGSAGRSRRLDDDRAQAILRAAYELLAETGYQGLRVDAVAARAQASKATLYRHWPTKAGLVTDAVRRCKAAEAAAPDTGSLRGDLLTWFGCLAENIRSEEGLILAGLFMAMHRDPELAAELRAMRESKTPHAAAICARAERRGELRPGYDAGLIEEIVPAQIFMRFFAFGHPIDEAFITHLTDDIILPLLTRDPSPPSDPTAPVSTAPGSAVPGSAVPGSAVPASTAPGSAVPGSAAPGSAAPGSAAPGSTAPSSTAPSSTAPSSAAPSSTAPSSTVSASTLPGEPR